MWANGNCVCSGKGPASVSETSEFFYLRTHTPLSRARPSIRKSGGHTIVAYCIMNRSQQGGRSSSAHACLACRQSKVRCIYDPADQLPCQRYVSRPVTTICNIKQFTAIIDTQNLDVPVWVNNAFRNKPAGAEVPCLGRMSNWQSSQVRADLLTICLVALIN